MGSEPRFLQYLAKHGIHQDLAKTSKQGFKSALLRRAGEDDHSVEDLTEALHVLDRWYVGKYMDHDNDPAELEKSFLVIKDYFSLSFQTTKVYRYIHFADKQDYLQTTKNRVKVRTGPGVRETQSWTDSFNAVVEFAQGYSDTGIIVSVMAPAEAVLMVADALRPRLNSLDAGLREAIDQTGEDHGGRFHKAHKQVLDLLSGMNTVREEHEVTVKLGEVVVEELWLPGSNGGQTGGWTQVEVQ
jgi:hypothetical protein